MQHPLPELLLQSLQTAPGFNQPAFEAVHGSGEQITSVRFNPAKWKVENGAPAAWTITNGHGPTITPIPWSSFGHYLSERPLFTLDPYLHAGAYYVQEASSMFVEAALQQTVDLTAPLKVLDACAAPGGKSTLIQSLISGESLLVSNEVIKTRAGILAENIAKWGASNVVVTNNDPRDFARLGTFFDVMVVDAPCSGSGLFRKDPSAIEEWSQQNEVLCSQRQQRILADLLPALQPGGVLIYSTCSYAELEDEAIADWLISQGMESIALQVAPEWGIVTTQSPLQQAWGYRFYPDQVKGEGFFIAAFRKVNGTADYHKAGKSPRITTDIQQAIQPWLQDPFRYSIVAQQQLLLAMPHAVANELSFLKNHLYIKKAGVTLGQLIRNELIPDHELAVSKLLSKNVVTQSVDLATALQYLRRQDFEVDSPVKGWVLLTYEGLAIGWIKAMQGRINNYYPKEWRILHK